MSLRNKPLEAITEADLKSLLANSVPESKTIDYKKILTVRNDEQKKEFLYDVSSFANSVGGDLVFGIDEDNGVPIDICGIDVTDLDAEKLRLEEIVRNGIAPRISGFAMQFIKLQNQQMVMILRIPPSFVSPHMVIFKGASKFYSRNSAGKYQMDVGEIRAAFALSETAIERIRNFRVERFKEIDVGIPISLEASAILALHLIPLRAFDPAVNFDAISLSQKAPRDLWVNEDYARFNLDGYLMAQESPTSRAAASYVQFFRNGIIEVVETTFCKLDSIGLKVIRMYYEGEILKTLPKLLAMQRSLGVETPIFCMLSFVGVKGYQIGRGIGTASLGGHPIDRDRLLIPEVVIDSFEADLSVVMKPAFDTVWNASGWEGSRNYDAQGNWIGQL